MPENNPGGSTPRQDRPGIQTVSTEPYRSFFELYTKPLRSVPTERLNQTRNWAVSGPLSRDFVDKFRQANDPNSEFAYLSWLTARVMDEEHTIRGLYEEFQDRPRTSVRAFITQTNPGMLSCQIVSAVNGLRQIGLAGSELTERAMIQELGGDTFVARNRNGMGTLDLIPSLRSLFPGINLERSASVAD